MDYFNSPNQQNSYLNYNQLSASQRAQVTYSPINTAQRFSGSQVRQETKPSSFVERVPQMYYPQHNNHSPQIMIAQTQQFSQQVPFHPSPIGTRIALVDKNIQENNNFSKIQPSGEISRTQRQSRQNIIMTPTKVIQSPIIFQTPNRSPIRVVEGNMSNNTTVTNSIPFQLHSPLPSNKQQRQQVFSESQQKQIIQRSVIQNVIGPQGNMSQIIVRPTKTQDNDENRYLQNRNSSTQFFQQHSLEKSQNQLLPSKNQLPRSLFPAPQPLSLEQVSTQQLQINTNDLSNRICPSVNTSKQQLPTRDITPNMYPSQLSVLPLRDSKLVNSQQTDNNRIPCLLPFPSQRQQQTKVPSPITTMLPPFSQNKINQTTCQIPRISSALSNYSNNETSGMINTNPAVVQPIMYSQVMNQQYYPNHPNDIQIIQGQQQNIMQIQQNKRTKRSNSALDHSQKPLKTNWSIDSQLPASQNVATFQRQTPSEANNSLHQGTSEQQSYLKNQTLQENMSQISNSQNKNESNSQILQAQAPLLTAQQITQSIHSNNRETSSRSFVQDNHAQSKVSKQDEEEANKFIHTQPYFNQSQDKSLESLAAGNQNQNCFQNTNKPNCESIDDIDSICNIIPFEKEQNQLNADSFSKQEIDKQNQYRAYLEDSEIHTKIDNSHVLAKEQEKRIEFQRECSKSPSKFFAHVKQQLGQLNLRTDHTNTSLADQSFSCKDTQIDTKNLSQQIKNTLNFQEKSRSRSQITNISRNDQSSTFYLERSRQKIQNIKDRIAQITQDRPFENDPIEQKRGGLQSNLERSSRQNLFEKKSSLQILLNPESSLEFDTDYSPIVDGQKVHLNQLRD